MSALFGILWFVALGISTLFVRELHGNIGLLNMFPEGKKWWHGPTRFLSLVVFALVVSFHPWR